MRTPNIVPDSEMSAEEREGHLQAHRQMLADYSEEEHEAAFEDISERAAEANAAARNAAE